MTRQDRLKKAVDHAAHLLPIQGPIGVFIHHNTLHAFQHLPFEQAVQEAARRFGAEPFMLEQAYRRELGLGRIMPEDLAAVVEGEPDAEVLPGRLTRRALRLKLLLEPGPCAVTPANASWLKDEGLLAVTREEEALLELCLARVLPRLAPPHSLPPRPRAGLLVRTGLDIDDEIHASLIRLCAAFFDQGLAYWPMPLRERGFYEATAVLLGRPATIEPALLQGLGSELRRQHERGLTAAEVVLDRLQVLGLEEGDTEELLVAELLALPGWAGLMRRLEEEPALAPHLVLPCSLMDFLAVRLTMTAVAAQNAWTRSGGEGPLGGRWREAAPIDEGSAQDAGRAQAAQLFDAARRLGLSADELGGLSDAGLEGLRAELEAFGDWERRRIWHLAYERRHEREILGPLLTHRRQIDPKRPAIRPEAQIFFCIDEREESIRRALEELEPSIETLSAAGFFGVAVKYQGLDDAHGVALCPAVVTPRHVVNEVASPSDRPAAYKRRLLRRMWALAARGVEVGTLTLVRGALVTGALGALMLVPLAGRLLAPRRAARAREFWLSLLPNPRTELTRLRPEDAGPTPDAAHGMLDGFDLQEQSERVAGLLRGAGLVEGFARLVVLLGHGSTSHNNPHESAHDCGACGGRHGAANARLFAAMANDPRVRARLPALGVTIPHDCWFVGGVHDTCSDAVKLYDLAEVPPSHEDDLMRVRAALDRARAAGALERARRFEAAAGESTPAEALHHVEGRANDLSEVRPEYGHCTNAVCFVGRRSVTRGLFLDRRAFLVSYDQQRDPTLASLAGLLGAAGPVCAGISLEYYFSFVDNARYGCGTKLPHNVTGLVGVMNGQASDLLTGLPWQMVEIHEPVRLLLIVESTPDKLMEAVGRSPLMTELVDKRWIRLAALDPEGRLFVRRHGAFAETTEEGPLPVVETSRDWYAGKLEHLPMARIATTAPHALPGRKA